MKIVQEMVKLFFIYLLVVTCIILFVLVPRTPNLELSGGWAGVMKYDYSFSLADYKNNVVGYLSQVVETKSLGPTKWKTRSVEDELLKFVPKSMLVVFLGLFLCLLFGVLKGIYDFRKTNTKQNLFGNGTTWLFQSIPDYFIIICVIWIVYFKLPFTILGDEDWYKFIAPGILVSIAPSFYVARLTSVSLLSQKDEPHIQVAFSKGFTEKLVLYRHMFKQCIITVSGYLPSVMVFLLSNLLVVEYLLAYEGAAYRLFSAIGYSNFISPSMLARKVDESGLIIGISICFLLFVMVAHIASRLIKLKLEPK
ncbi:ABC transporter permease subunit [Bacillus luteolus]|uniref:ABC transporter permease subunit n=1 Tax=Litchfieldia luteola TaxID=682179 RepID=A0ABR9QKQ8_9BACI|nr:ABC transporter permease subunit [Cytobacillus luteolus]MBE4909080.1 ABC transporter permease subunit [Cytobacillus luteolus]MBP1941936.1 ABC-type dipeptide/oligopeptide/nickel transport system permease component [Cytobacillus luteolus]